MFGEQHILLNRKLDFQDGTVQALAEPGWFTLLEGFLIPGSKPGCHVTEQRPELLLLGPSDAEICSGWLGGDG